MDTTTNTQDTTATPRYNHVKSGHYYKLFTYETVCKTFISAIYPDDFFRFKHALHKLERTYFFGKTNFNSSLKDKYCTIGLLQFSRVTRY